MSADNFIGIWFDGARWRVDTCSASTTFTTRAQLEKHFEHAACFSERADAFAFAADQLNKGEYEYGMREIKTPHEEKGVEITRLEEVRERFKVVEDRVADCETANGRSERQAAVTLARVDATEKAIIGHEQEIQRLNEAMKQRQIEMPAWLKMTALVEQYGERLDRLEAHSTHVVESHKFAGLHDRVEALAERVKKLEAPPDEAAAATTAHQRLSTERWALGTPEARAALDKMLRDAPRIVTLCGSTRFSEAFARANLAETLAGRIVLTVGSMTHSDDELSHCRICGKTGEREELMSETCSGRELKDGEGGVRSVNPHRILPSLAPETKERLDALHLRKIELADECLILNVVAQCPVCKYIYGDDQGQPDYCEGDDAHRHNQSPLKPYIGDSTKNEIRHALMLGKPLRFLNPQGSENLTGVGMYGPFGPTMDVLAMMCRLGLEDAKRCVTVLKSDLDR